MMILISFEKFIKNSKLSWGIIWSKTWSRQLQRSS